MLSREAAYTIFMVFCVNGLGLEHTIYDTWSEHPNHYTTDAVYI
jgi:hypothetical protein